MGGANSAGSSGAAGAGARGGGAGLAGSDGAGMSSAGMSGAGPSDIPVSDGMLGAACENAAACADGLTCLTEASQALGGGGPSAGLCTLACEQGESICKALSASAACVYFADGAAYCFEGCEFGDATAETKCHARPSMACASVFDAEPQGQLCNAQGGCPVGFACAEGNCFATTTACVPQCSSDADCAAPRQCDAASGYSAFGLCRDDAPQGLVTGQACDVSLSRCRGGCLPLDDTTAVCGDGCTFGAQAACGWSGSGTASAACLSLLYEEQGLGDAALCLQLCDCNDDCDHPSLSCQAFPSDSTFDEKYGRVGYCYLAESGASGIACP